MNAVVAHEERSVFASMAKDYGMEKAAFEQTLMATIMPKDTTRAQVAAFLLVAKQYGLNPFTKELFAFPSRGGIQPVVSVDGWMKLINSHHEFDGMTFVDVHDTSGNLVSVTCKMYRKDRTHPVEVTEYMAECRRETDVWKRWPARMLRHKAAIQASRYAFGFSGIMEPDEYERTVEAEVVRPALVDSKMQAHTEAVERHAEALLQIRDGIANDLGFAVAERWYGIPQEDQIAIYSVAPTKGGWFTTAERDYIKNKLPREAVAEAEETK